MPELLFSYYFLLLFPLFNQAGQSEPVGIMQAAARLDPSSCATRCLHLFFPCLWLTQEMSVTSRLKREEHRRRDFFCK